MIGRTDAAGGWRFRAARWAALAGVAVVSLPATAQDDYEAQWRAGDYDAALDRVEELLGPDYAYGPAPIMRDRAELLFTVGRYEDAIQAMAGLAEDSRELRHWVRLIEMADYVGDTNTRARAMAAALDMAERGRSAGPYRENILALARLTELEGEDPKKILGTYFQILFERMPTFAPAYVAAGDLAYRHYGYDMAAKHYRKAIELDGKNTDALAGLANCFWKSGDPRLEDAVDAILSINPNHFDANAILTARLLDNGRAEEALARANAALAVNPNHLRFLGLKAAAQFLLDDKEGMGATQARAERINPSASVVYRIPGRVASRRYRFASGARLQREALALNPDDHDARALLAFDLLRLGRDADGRAELERAFAADPFRVTAYNMLEVLDSVDGFATLSTPDFVVQLPEPEARAMGDAILALLEEALAHYEAKYAIALTRPVRVQLFDDHDEFMVRSVGLPGSVGHLGICFGQLITMDSPRARRPRTVNWRSVPSHEFVHVVTLQKTAHRMPRWLSEGISIYEEGVANPAWGQPLDPDFKALLDKAALPGIEDLERYFTQPETPLHLTLGYFLSGEFVQAYVDAYSMAALNEALDRIAGGMNTVTALAESAVVPVSAIDAIFREHLTKRIAPLKNLPDVAEPTDDFTTVFMGGGAPPWRDRASVFTDLMRKGDALAENGARAAARAAYEAAHAAYPEYFGPDAPLRKIAELYAEPKTTEDAIDYVLALQRIIAWDATSADAALELAKRVQADGRHYEALHAVDYLLGVDPFDTEALRIGLEAAEAFGEYATALRYANTLIYLDETRAHAHRLRYAKLLAGSGQLAEARRAVVELLERTPQFAEAQDLLLELVRAGDDT